MPERVVITGIGIVSPLGSDNDAFFRQLCAGASGIAPIDAFDTAGFPAHRAALVRGFEARDHISLKNLRRMDRLSQMATAAARLALGDAGIAVGPANRDRIGILIGTAFGPTDVIVQYARTLFTKGPAFVNPILVPNTVMNAPAGHASIELGFRGINSTVNQHAVSAEAAIAYAVAEIRNRRADALLAGGAEIVSPFLFESLLRFRALSPQDGEPEGSRPFDRRRNGFVLGEGCGILCLESLASACRRGAAPYAEIAGCGWAGGPCSPSDWPRAPEGAILAMSRALSAAAIPPSLVDVCQAAANGSATLDAMEARALEGVFGGEAPPAIFSLKGALGECFSSGGLRAAAQAMALSRGEIPPTAGLRDAITRLPVVQDAPRRRPLTWGLLNGISFGGSFVSLVLKRATGEAVPS